MFMKSNDCAKYLTSGTFSEAAERIAMTSADAAKAAVEIAPLKEVLGRISVFEEESDDLEQTDLPGGQGMIDDQAKAAEDAATELVRASEPNSPCFSSAFVAQAAAGAILTPGLYQAKGGGDVVQLIEPADFSSLTEYTKSIHRELGIPADIDAQHPIRNLDTYGQAYLADVVDIKSGDFIPNDLPDSRLEATLDQMEEAGVLNHKDRAAVTKETLDHWKNGTVPASLEESPNNIQESFFKIGKLITRR